MEKDGMIYLDLCNLVLNISEEECDSTFLLIQTWVDSYWLKLGSFSNNYVSFLKYEAMMKNFIDH